MPHFLYADYILTHCPKFGVHLLLRSKVEQETAIRTKKSDHKILIQIFNTDKLIAECYAKQYLNSFHVYLMHVQKHYRKQGYGKMLLNALEEVATSRKINFITLNTVINNSAKSFYLKLGFKLEFERLGYTNKETCCYFIKTV